MVVREPASDVMLRALAYRRNLLHSDACPSCSDSRQPDHEGESPSQE
jgi:hypothetical protein